MLVSHKIYISLHTEMKQMLRIVRMLVALSAVLLTVLLNWQDKDTMQIQEASQQPQSAVLTSHSRHNHEATLTDASNLYRICSSRPQRINPTHGSKTERAASCVWQYFVKPLNIFHDSRYKLTTTPFCLSASRHYYVIALRHIIC